jgi:phosphoribosylglycinamide formyltransferase-1
MWKSSEMTAHSIHPLRLVVLVSGRGSNLGGLIRASQERKIQSQIVAVISNRADALALTKAKTAGIPIRTILSKGVSTEKFSQELLQTITSFQPDLIVLAGFMKILAPSLIQAYAGKIINIHPSLLPAFPGLHAQKQALAAHAKISGCTVHYVDEGCDTGPIILQKTVPVLAGDTEETLSQRILVQEHKALVESIILLESNL